MIRYIVGDATKPQCSGNKIITHICNDIGVWGAGFVLAVSDLSPKPEAQYRAWYMVNGPLPLGENQLVQVKPDLWVCNMIAQRSVGHSAGTPPIRYKALEKCLKKLAVSAKELQASIHMPRIGCGLAGGSWDAVGPMVEDTLKEFDVIVYDFRSWS